MRSRILNPPILPWRTGMVCPCPASTSAHRAGCRTTRPRLLPGGGRSRLGVSNFKRCTCGKCALPIAGYLPRAPTPRQRATQPLGQRGESARPPRPSGTPSAQSLRKACVGQPFEVTPVFYASATVSTIAFTTAMRRTALTSSIVPTRNALRTSAGWIFERCFEAGDPPFIPRKVSVASSLGPRTIIGGQLVQAQLRRKKLLTSKRSSPRIIIKKVYTHLDCGPERRCFDMRFTLLL